MEGKRASRFWLIHLPVTILQLLRVCQVCCVVQKYIGDVGVAGQQILRLPDGRLQLITLPTAQQQVVVQQQQPQQQVATQVAAQQPQAAAVQPQQGL